MVNWKDSSDFRKDLVRQIRVVQPDVVLTTEPYRRNMQWHRDHRIAGQVALDAVFPYSRDHLHFGDLFANEGNRASQDRSDHVLGI